MCGFHFLKEMPERKLDCSEAANQRWTQAVEFRRNPMTQLLFTWNPSPLRWRGVVRCGVAWRGAAWRRDPGKTAPLRGLGSEEGARAIKGSWEGASPWVRLLSSWRPWKEGSQGERGLGRKVRGKKPQFSFENSSFLKSIWHPRRPKPRIQK